MTRVRPAVLTLILVAALLTGCGVPDSGDPERLSAAPGAGDAAGPSDTVALPTPVGATTPEELVRRYLKAGAAADWEPDVRKEGRIADAVTHASTFLTRDGQLGWQPGNVLTVVQITELQGRVDNSVLVLLEPVGVLDEAGVLNPPVSRQPLSYVFNVSAGGGPMLLNAVPNGLYLSTDGLGELFEVRPVYFWTATDRYLVPDRRYLRRGMSESKRAQAIVERVLAGPSQFLKNTVAEVPVTTTEDNVVLDGNRISVNLSPGLPADPEQKLREIAYQLRWSLHPRTYPLELKIGGRHQFVDDSDGYLRYNPSLPPPARSIPDDDRLYLVMGGKVVPYGSGGGPPSILSAPENSVVVLAAANRTVNTAALVRATGPGGTYQLWLGRHVADQAPAHFARANLPATVAMSRPSYVPGSGDRVLIVADGRLYDVGWDGSAREVPVGVGGLRAVAVAPDGARVAFVTDTAAYVAALDASSVPAAVNSLLPLRLGGLDALCGVGWLYEHQLVVAGAAGLVNVAIDNGYLEAITPSNLQGAQVTQLSAVPWDPVGGERGNYVVEAGSPPRAYFAYRSGMRQVEPPSVAASASPSASGTAAGNRPRPTAPFYIDVE